MVKIVADSTCDLSQELIKRYDISILPLHILLGDQEYEDGVSLSAEEIYRWSDEHNTTPKTSAPSIERAKELFEPLLKSHEALVCFSISGQMSASGRIMQMAAEELQASDKISVVDSQNLSTGIGLLVIEAAIMAQEGRTASDIVRKMSELIPLVRASFVVDTLVYLHRGGRCGGLAAMLGSALKLHPQIVVEEGKMHSTRKYRGQLSHVVMAYVKDLEPAMREAKKDRVFITHSGCEENIVNAVYNYLKGLDIFQEILVTRAGGVVSSHCGPGTLGVLFIQ